jgi:hypothetical protein
MRRLKELQRRCGQRQQRLRGSNSGPEKFIKISFIIRNPNETPFCEEITNTYSRPCGSYGVAEKITGTWCENLTERDHL